MKNRYVFFIVIILSMCFTSSAVSETAVAFGDYKYYIPSEWINDLAEDESSFNYHYENGTPFDGGYLMTRVYKVDSGMSEYETQCFLNAFMDSMVDGIELKKYAVIDLELKGPAGTNPHKTIVGETELFGPPFDLFVHVWIDSDYAYALTFQNVTADFDSTKAQFMNILETARKYQNVKNSRKQPAYVGESIAINAKRDGLTYAMRVKVDNFYRGDEYKSLVGKYSKSAPYGSEYVAVKVTVCFEQIIEINERILGTDDPEISVDAIFEFDTYTSSGTRYDNVHYSITGFKELTDIYEGASTTGYFHFMIDADDPAPLLVYEPEHGQKVWISLK